jgi:hypothetical protein
MKINRLIPCLRSFLLTSEYFDSPLALHLHRLSLQRNLHGVETRLEVSTSNFALAISQSELQKVFSQLEKIIEGTPVDIQVSRGEYLDILITAKTDKSLTPVVLQRDALRIRVISDS